MPKGCGPEGPALARGLSSLGRVYVKPVLEADGREFCSVELLIDRPDREMLRLRAGISEIESWAKAEGRDVTRRVGSLIGHCRAGRLARAGMSFENPRIMGVLNVTPDSFSDGGLFDDAEGAVAQGRRMIADGADIIDIGGESTRPGATTTPADQEIARIRPVITALREAGRPLSVDTRNAATMDTVVGLGCTMINDISALEHDPMAMPVAASSDAVVALMHNRGNPASMQQRTDYRNILTEVFDYLQARITACETAGLARSRIVVDPGLGFGKTGAQNFALLRDLSLFRGLGVPLLVGVSRKSFIGRATGVGEARERVAGSVGGGLWAVAQGADIIRVHDVLETRQALDVWAAAAGGCLLPKL
jgi:dihydropteroate synthase